MTEIPIERKRHIPWIPLGIAAAVLLLLLWWLFDGRDERAVVTPVPSAVTAPIPPVETVAAAGAAAPNAPASTDVIVDLAVLLDSPPAAVIGRPVRLTNVPAGAVPADAGFWLTGADGKREYVVLHEVETPNSPIEGRVDVDEGDRLDVIGVVRPASAGAPEGAAIPGPTAPLPKGIDHFIEATLVTQTGQPPVGTGTPAR